MKSPSGTRCNTLAAFALGLAVLGFFASESRADENFFGYVYGSETLPEGAQEFYVWTTLRKDKGVGSYTAWDVDLEYERALTDRAQMSLYLTSRAHNHSGAAPLEDDGTGNLVPEYRDLNRGLTPDGVKVSFKYAFLSPYKDAIGFAGYIEPSYRTIFKISGEKMKQTAIELKAILQKNFLDDQLVFAYNATVEFERRIFDGADDHEIEMEWEQTAGVSYRFAPNWFAGLEFRNHTEWVEPGFAKEHSAYFFGPNLHYGAKDWWFTFTWLPQIHGKPTDPERSPDLHLLEHEKNEFRLKVGYNF